MSDAGQRRIDRFVRLMVTGYRRLPWPRSISSLLAGPYRAFLRRQRSRVVVATIAGITYELDLGEMIDAVLYFEGAWERRATDSVRRLLRPGMTAIDVGANFGYYTLTMAQVVGEAGTVIGFEPTRWALRKLERNVALNPFRNIRIEPVALADVQSEREILPGERAFRASWSMDGNPRTESDLVTFTTLDEYLTKNRLSSVDFIKTDVDGLEYRVIRGAIDTLEHLRPLMLLEIGPSAMEEVGDRPDELVRLLDSLDYEFFSEDGRSSLPPQELLSWLPKQGSNVLVCPAERMLSLLPHTPK